MSVPPAPGALWKEARAGDGRVYYYNTVTKETQWTKPEEMMSAQEVSSMSGLLSSPTYLTQATAFSLSSTMERVRYPRRSQVLVQHPEQTECVDYARRV